MGENNYLKIVWLVAFVAFAAVSCWATAESLHLLLSSWPTVMCWIVTVGFFIIASFGTKMIADSLSSSSYVENRGVKLAGGIVITLVFWLVCSLPTNTHTFFYRTMISDKVNTDLSTTRGYLGQIKNNVNYKNQASEKVNELKNKVDVLLGELEAEIKNEVNPGFGSKSKEILRKFATLLGVDKIEPLSYTAATKEDRIKLCDAYRTKIYILMDNKAANIKSNILAPNADNLAEVKKIDNELAEIEEGINNSTIDLNNVKDIDNVCLKLNSAYNTVKKNKDFVNFSSEEDEAVYTANNPLTKIKRLLSVFDVWKDFFSGVYAGHGFIFWVLISALVDIAAFIFFDLAFKKSDY